MTQEISQESRQETLQEESKVYSYAEMPKEALQEELRKLEGEIREAEKQLLQKKSIEIPSDYEISRLHYLDQDRAKKLRIEAQERNKIIEKEIEELKEKLHYPLLLTQSVSIKDFLRAKKEEEEKKKREEKKAWLLTRPINLKRYISRREWCGKRHWAGKLVGLAEKRENQILKQICEIQNLALVKSTALTSHYQRKLKRYRLTKAGQGLYLLPLAENASCAKIEK